MIVNTFACCSSCWHSSDKPCPDLIDCFHNGPLCHTDEKCSESIRERNGYLSRSVVEKPAIYIGTGTCGLAAGADKTITKIREYLDASSIDAEIIETGCIGFCAGEPLMDVQLPGRKRVSFTMVTAEKAAPILDGVFNGSFPVEGILGQHNNSIFESNTLEAWPGVPGLDEHPFFAPQKRWVLSNCGVIDPSSLGEYVLRGGYSAYASALKEKTPTELCELLEESGLRGRGGGGFPLGTKWKLAAREKSEQKYIVCNADEGDPGAFMDRAVIEGDPHRLLEGVLLSAYGIGASKAYIYIRAEYPLAIARLEQAIKQIQELGLLGTNILDSGFKTEIIIKKGAGAFVCGEETALMHSIEGKRGMPRPKPPYPAVQRPFWETHRYQQCGNPGEYPGNRKKRR